MPDPSEDCNTPTLAHVIEVVSKRFDVSVVDLKSARRDRRTAWARQCYYLLAREHTLKSFHQIALSTGGRDHSTVIYGVDTARHRLDRDERYAELYRQCVNDLGALL